MSNKKGPKTKKYGCFCNIKYFIFVWDLPNLEFSDVSISWYKKNANLPIFLFFEFTNCKYFHNLVMSLFTIYGLGLLKDNLSWSLNIHSHCS
jgi:hypothetical protein